eukprot:6752561-Karenia_brevis.AAC.1
MGYDFPGPPSGKPADPDLIYPGWGMQGGGDRGHDGAISHGISPQTIHTFWQPQGISPTTINAQSTTS